MHRGFLISGERGSVYCAFIRFTERGFVMRSSSSLMRDVRRENGSEAALKAFSQGMKETACGLASARLALNLVSFEESFRDPDQRLKPHPLTEESRSRMRSLLTSFFDGTEGETAPGILALREENISHMALLSACADRFVIYEYVLNRQEYRFRNDRLPEDYSDAEQAEALLEQLKSIEDPSVRQTMLVSLVEQLPMRMTKARFFRILSEGLNSYCGSEREIAEELFGELRHAALLSLPEEAGQHYPALTAIMDELMKADYRNLDRETFFRLTELAGTGMEELNRQMGLVMLMQEVLNDAAVLCLCGETGRNAGASALCRRILAEQETSGEAINEAIAGDLEQLEGIQETESSGWLSFTASLEEIREVFRDSIRKAGLEEDYGILSDLGRLLSGSAYARLTGGQLQNAVSADEAWVRDETLKLIAELEQQFSGLSRPVNRAIMAKMLSMLPLFVRSAEELEDYVLGSLQACTDEAEKLACLELAREILS